MFLPPHPAVEESPTPPLSKYEGPLSEGNLALAAPWKHPETCIVFTDTMLVWNIS